TDCFHDACQIGGAATEPAKLGGNRQAEEPEIRQDLPSLATVAFRRCNDAPARIEAVVARNEPLDRRGQKALLLGESEVHLEPEHPLRDNVALNLVRARVDRRLAIVA